MKDHVTKLYPVYRIHCFLANNYPFDILTSFVNVKIQKKRCYANEKRLG